MAYDWDIIKTEYVQGFVDKDGNLKLPTLNELCNRYGCSYSHIKHMSSDGKWVYHRKHFKKHREACIREKKLDIVVNEAAEFDSEALKASKNGIKEVIKYLKKPDLSTLDYQKLSISLINYQKVGLLALGEPTERVDNINKHDVIIDDTLKEADVRADLSVLYERWDKKTDKSSRLSED